MISGPVLFSSVVAYVMFINISSNTSYSQFSWHPNIIYVPKIEYQFVVTYFLADLNTHKCVILLFAMFDCTFLDKNSLYQRRCHST